MLKAPMFFIVFLGSRTGADRSERCLRQIGRRRTPHERRLIAKGGRRAAETKSSPLRKSYGAAFAAPITTIRLLLLRCQMRENDANYFQPSRIQLAQFVEREP